MTTPSTSAVSWIQSRTQHDGPVLLYVRPGHPSHGSVGFPASGEIQLTADGQVSGGASEDERIFARSFVQAWTAKLCDTSRNLPGMMADMWREVVRYSTQKCLEDNTAYCVMPGYKAHVPDARAGKFDIELGFSLCDTDTAARLVRESPAQGFISLQTIPFQPTSVRVTHPVRLQPSPGYPWTSTHPGEVSWEELRPDIDPDWRPSAITDATQCGPP